MTTPDPIPAPATDPITAILLAVTRIEGQLANALATINRHDGAIETHTATLNEHGNRLVALETARAGDTDHEMRGVSRRTVFWTAVAAIVAIMGLIITLFAITHHGA